MIDRLLQFIYKAFNSMEHWIFLTDKKLAGFFKHFEGVLLGAPKWSEWASYSLPTSRPNFVENYFSDILLILGRSSDNLCVSRDIEARLPYGFEMVCQMANHFLVNGHSE